MNRYTRNQDLIDQKLLDKCTVIGAGGIGSSLLQNAAIMGFNEIDVWDNDILEVHNLSTTSWSEQFLNQSKVAAAKSTLSNLNIQTKVNAHNELWNKGNALNDIVFLTPDNMEIRREVYLQWAKMDTRVMLIDMRMGALGFEIITATKDHDHYLNSWIPSHEIEDEACTAKHTIFCGSLAASYGLSQAFCVFAKRPYYQYIWGNLSPVSIRREHLVNYGDIKAYTNEYRAIDDALKAA